MSTHKHIDIICVAVVILTLVLTVLFMSGESLGIAVITSEENESGMFTQNDLNSQWDASNATRISLEGGSAAVSGSGAYAIDGTVYIVGAGTYTLSGNLDNGSVIIDAGREDKIWLLLDGASIYCRDNGAIVVEQAGKVFITLAEGTENYLGAGTPEDEVIDGVIYSRDDLTINGGGTLTVSAEYKHGIVCNDDLVLSGGRITVRAVQDGVHANDSVRICDSEITINAGDDGITVSNDDDTAFIYILSGKIDILSCYEGLEAVDITIDGGDINICPTDDGINGNRRSSLITINGGNITIVNNTGRDADGIDSNKDILINGGTLLISLNNEGSNCALDYGSENGGTCKINGGTVVACGGSSMLEEISAESAQGFIMKTTSGSSAGTSVTLADSDGNILISQSIPCSFSSVILSTEGMKTGDSYTLSIADTAEQVTVDNSSGVSGDMGMHGGFGGMGGDRFGDSFRQPNQNTDQPQNDMGGFRGGMNDDGASNPGMDNGFRPDGTAPDFSGDQQGGFPGMPGTDAEMPSPDGAAPDFSGDEFTMPDGAEPDAFGNKQGGMKDFGKGELPTDEAIPGVEDGFSGVNGRWENEDKQFDRNAADGTGAEALLWVGMSFAVLVLGIAVAAVYKKRV